MGRVFNPELEIQNMITEIKKYFVQNVEKPLRLSLVFLVVRILRLRPPCLSALWVQKMSSVF
jgi:hypothetical protein